MSSSINRDPKVNETDSRLLQSSIHLIATFGALLLRLAAIETIKDPEKCGAGLPVALTCFLLNRAEMHM
jgi:hypothetical protein